MPQGRRCPDAVEVIGSPRLVFYSNGDEKVDSWRIVPRRRWRSTGSRWPARCESRSALRLMPQKPMPISSKPPAARPNRRLGQPPVGPAREPAGARAGGRRVTAAYAIGSVPRPPYWIGYRLMPLSVEFCAIGHSVCTSGSCSDARASTSPGTRPCSIRKDGMASARITPAARASYAPPYRCQPRYGLCHGQALFQPPDGA